jgi:hypothetical protein
MKEGLDPSTYTLFIVLPYLFNSFCYAAFFDRTFFTDDYKFDNKTFFNNVLFVDKEKVIFDVENLSKVSFMNTDITQIEFGENCHGEKKKNSK